MAVEDTSTADLALRPAAAASSSSQDFDIIATYKAILESDPSLTKPVVVIKALIELLGATKSSTVFETLELVKSNSARLKASTSNPVPLRAGADLFQHNLVQWLRNQQDAVAGGPTATASNKPPSQYPSFDDVRRHLLRNTREFAQQALDARDSVAESGWRFLDGEQRVLTHGASRAVISILIRAAVEQHKKNSPGGAPTEAASQDGVSKKDSRFKVVYVRDEARAAESDRVVAELRGHGIAVAEIPLARVATVLRTPGPTRPNFVLLGAEAVTHDGGIISRVGTALIVESALQSPHIPVRVAAETHKFVRTLPLSVDDIVPIASVLHYQGDEEEREGEEAKEVEKNGHALEADEVDWTPGHHISCLITEVGIMQPGDVAMRLLDLYGTLATR
jgi:translation initiation factor eIF-2B subunit alpha